MAHIKSSFIVFLLLNQYVNGQSIESAVDSYLWPIIAALAVFTICVVIICVYFCRKNPRKCTLKAIRTIIVISFLFEDILALLWEDGDLFGDRFIFYVFWIFTAINGLFICCKCNRFIDAGLSIFAELAQTILFIIFSNFYIHALYTFPLFWIFQAILECIHAALDKPEDIEEEQQDDFFFYVSCIIYDNLTV